MKVNISQEAHSCLRVYTYRGYTYYAQGSKAEAGGGGE